MRGERKMREGFTNDYSLNFTRPISVVNFFNPWISNLVERKIKSE